MKSIIITAAIFLTGWFCAWGSLAAQSDGEKSPYAVTPAKGSLLEIREPLQEDFVHCATRAVDFLEPISNNQTQTDLALQILFSGEAPLLESTVSLAHMSEAIVNMNSDATFGRPELIAKKSLGANILILYYN